MTTTPKASRFRLGLNRAQKPPAPTATPEQVAQPVPPPPKARGIFGPPTAHGKTRCRKKWD